MKRKQHALPSANQIEAGSGLLIPDDGGTISRVDHSVGSLFDDCYVNEDIA
jgi:hypothetical protein